MCKGQDNMGVTRQKLSIISPVFAESPERKAPFTGHVLMIVKLQYQFLAGRSGYCSTINAFTVFFPLENHFRKTLIEGFMNKVQRVRVLDPMRTDGRERIRFIARFRRYVTTCASRRNLCCNSATLVL